MAISKIKLPDNISATDIHDSRISGIDSIPTANSVNLITSGGTKTYIDGALLFESGVGSNSVVQKGSNNTAFGNNSIIEGISSAKATEQGIVSGSSDSNIINAWITSPFALAKGIASHVEGNNGLALANYSHVEGLGTIAINVGEHAEGQYNKSNATTISSVGIGTSSTRKNAFEIMQNGNTYIYGIGNYDGTNSISGTPASIQQIINGQKTTNQELVFRKTGVNWSPNTLTLDRILGRSLAWNQQIDGTNNSAPGVTVTFADNVFTLSGTCTAAWVYGVFKAKIISGHKYFISSKVISGSMSNSGRIYNGYNVSTAVPIGSAGIFEPNGNSNDMGIGTTSGTVFNSLKLKVVCVDLTLMFGAGNEPTAEAFEKDYPLSYYPYDAGSLISNDASALETTGFNKWDEEWGLGSINENGVPVSSTTTIRSKNYIAAFGNTAYKITCKSVSTSQIVVCFYDANKVFIPYTGPDAYANGYNGGSGLFTTPVGTAFMLFRCTSTYGNTYNHDICINLSDATRNGQYEPYWKRTLNLGLNSFKVKSPNIWDETYTNNKGIKASDGTLANDTGTGASSFVPVKPNTLYSFSKCGISSRSLGVAYYDKDKTYISGSVVSESSGTNFRRSTPANAYYLRFSFPVANFGQVMVNVDDVAFNGRYFSHEDITITGGLKGNGDWADYIVGNKYVKRAERAHLGGILSSQWTKQSTGNFITNVFQSTMKGVSSHSTDIGYLVSNRLVASIWNAAGTNNEMAVSQTSIFFVGMSGVDSTSALVTALNGVYLDYALQYPETYELVEPLVTTVKAGTTEARISPNADGLSAPFCADIQYGSTHADLANDINSVYVGAQNGLEEVRSTFQETVDGIRTLLSNI